MRFFWLTFFVCLVFQLNGQTISGTVKTVDGEVLAFANVALIKGNEVIGGVATDENGSFTLTLKQCKRCKLEFSYVGYYTETLSLYDVLEDKIIHKTLKQNSNVINMFPEIVYPTALIEGHVEFNKREFETTAGAFDDPSRLVMKHPGVANPNDQANGIIYRGIPSHFNTWQIFDVDIVNPNHLSNAGNLSDLSAPTSGGVNVFSGRIIDAYRFESTPLGISQSEALGGTSMVKPKEKGNNYLNLGLLGLELGANINPIKSANIYFNYRYSTVGLLSDLGVNFGNEKIRFQDLAIGGELFKNKIRHKLSYFIVIGNSRNNHEAFEEKSEVVTFKDIKNIDFSSKIGIFAARYEYVSKNQLKFRSTISYSIKEDSRASNVGVDYQQEFVGFNKLNINNQSKLSSHISLAKVFANNHLQLGLKTSIAREEFTQEDFNTSLDTVLNYATVYPYIEYGGEWLDFYYTIGLATHYRTHIKALPIENYLKVAYPLREEIRFQLLARRATSNPATSHQLMLASSENLKPVDLNSIEFSFVKFGRSHNFRTSIFYNRIRKLLLFEENFLNYYAFDQSNYNPEIQLVYGLNNSFAHTYGLSFFAAKAFLKNQSLNINLNGAAFRARTKRPIFHSYMPARTDMLGTINLGVDKKFVFANKSQLLISSSFHLRGRLLEKYIDQEQSVIQKQTVFFETSDSPFSDELFRRFGAPEYQRLDLRITYKSRQNKKWRHSVSLDIQNLLNRKNNAFRYYDFYRNSVFMQDQLGLIPVLNYKIEF